MNLNPQTRIPDHLDTVLPSGRTVLAAANLSARQRRDEGLRRAQAAYGEVRKPGWLARLFDGR